MMEGILYFLHGAVLVLFGAFLSGAFAGVSFSRRKNRWVFVIVCALCGGLQLLTSLLLGEEAVWKLYPINTHLPLALLLWLGYRKHPITAVSAVVTAYLFCQPVKWIGLLTFTITHSAIAEYIARICFLMIIAVLTLRFLAPYFARIYQQHQRSAWIFGLTPAIYYVFDYATMIYTDLWMQNNRLVAEFLPCFLGAAYLVFCILYCIENERKINAEHKAEITSIAVEQQKKELDAMKRKEQEIRRLHHDMRLFLSTLSVCLEEGQTDQAKALVSSYLTDAEPTKVQRFCSIDLINYILSDFAAKCDGHHVAFQHKVEIGSLDLDLNMVASILSNALDNALNAQKDLPQGDRRVKLTMKTVNEKLLLSVENPVATQPVFRDGFPVSHREGHGYGTQSIRYLTERLNGKCQFQGDDSTFIVKVIL
ncbi:MAG: GHKL domain-containing protein [Oscillospiraceae bacterium]|nr:GHKL domain-containing protein [Oscillospiraceae bacterium]